MKKRIVLVVLMVLILVGICQVFFYEEPLPISNYIVLDNGNLAYDEYGAGEEVIILVHGSPGGKETFEKLASWID